MEQSLSKENVELHNQEVINPSDEEEGVYRMLSKPTPLLLLAHFGNDNFPIFNDEQVEPERTPVNSERSFTFIDSGTESICSESLSSAYEELSACDDCAHNRMASDRIFKFFASASASTSEMDSDSSTISESSVLSPSCVDDLDDEDTETEIITPESMVAAIDKKIRQEVEQARIDIALAGNNLDGNFLDVQNEITFSRNGAAIDTIQEEVEDSDVEDNDEMHTSRLPLVRSTSLKTGKTPPGTPRGKKIVRFADALGLDLASVRHIVDDGGPYMPPLAAFKALKLDDEERAWLYEQTGIVGMNGNNCNNKDGNTKIMQPPTRPTLRVLFAQPSCEPACFLQRVRTNKVCLENCMVTGPEGALHSFTITAIVRVLNIAFEKMVTLRYSTNEWLTWTDVPTVYVPHSSDGFSDKFQATFTLAVNANGHQAMMPGQRLVFALRYVANQCQEFWDNNAGLNYAIIYQRC